MNHVISTRRSPGYNSAAQSVSLLVLALVVLLGPIVSGCGFIDCLGDLFDCNDDDDDHGGVPDPAWQGEYDVGFTLDVAHDAEVGLVPLAIWYPAGSTDGHQRAQYSLWGGVGRGSDMAYRDTTVSDTAPNTLIVYSHGQNSINVEIFPIMESLASHGFVVVAPLQSGWLLDLDQTLPETARWRVPEVSATIDHMYERANNRGDRFYQRIAEGQVGAFGYSQGGTTAIGTLVGWGGAPRDPRVTAVVAIAPTLYQGTTDPLPLEEFSSVRAPVLMLGASADENVEPDDQDLAYHELTGSPAVYDAVVQGANHYSFVRPLCFVGIPALIGLGFLDPTGTVEGLAEACSPWAPIDIERVEQLQQTYLVSFARRHLLGETEYERFLTRERANVQLRVRTQ